LTRSRTLGGIAIPSKARLEHKGAEFYPSQDKAALFFEVPDLPATIVTVGRERFAQIAPTWALLYDPEGYNVLLLQAAQSSGPSAR
jgi:hypothetical protein